MIDGREVWVSILTLEILTHEVSRRELADVLEWAAHNRDLLMAKFREYNP